MVELKQVIDIFSLSKGDKVTRSSLYHLIQHSKERSSGQRSGPDSIINNTPQQGINWIGQPPNVRAVIVKAKLGSYHEDGWSDEQRTLYKYSFKANKGVINYGEKANAVLINQPQYNYPIFLFIEGKKLFANQKEYWCFEGVFFVEDIEKIFLTLRQRGPDLDLGDVAHFEWPYYVEGDRRYVKHLLIERNHQAVKDLKEAEQWLCDICEGDFNQRYGVSYIEAHHKIPLSTFPSSHQISLSDFALLCPNCHRAVHLYMKRDGLDYTEISRELKRLAHQA